jgi:hypothetical protein
MKLLRVLAVDDDLIQENLTGLVGHAGEVVSRFSFDGNDCGRASCSTASRLEDGWVDRG